MAFDFDEGNPTDSAIVSGYPANERAARKALNDFADIEHDETTGHHKFTVGNDAARDAITDWVVGSLWISTQTSDTALERVVSIGPVVWETITATPGDGTVTTAKIAANAVTGAKIAMGSDAQGDVLHYGGTDYERLVAGTSGQYFKTQGSGANPVWATISGSLITAGTTLTQNPFAINAEVSQAHGLGAEPTFFKVVLECLTGDQGYSTGDRIILSASVITASGSHENFNIIANATNVILVTENSNPLTIVNKSTRARVNITSANWKLEVLPYLFAAAT